MNLIEASSLLYNYFNKYDSFSEDDFHLLREEKITESDKAAILCSLDSFREGDLVKATSVKNRNYWVLSRPFAMLNQTIDVSAPIAMVFSNVVNAILESKGLPKQSDPQKLSERDLLIVIDFLSKTEEKTETPQ